jgi:hypothetical protein
MIARISSLAALSVCLLSMPDPASADLITDALAAMPANSWQKLNINTFESVWTPVAQRPSSRWAPDSNISAWSGAAWDRGRGNLYIWGGDIGEEEGNEVYIFSGRTGRWSRGALPSQITTTNGVMHTVDGVMNAPLSGESWDNVVFLDNVNRMAVIGVSRNGPTWRDPSTGNFTGPYFWDPAKADPNKVSGLTGSQVDPSAFPNVVGGQMWQNRNTPLGDHAQGTTAYLNVNGKDVVYVTDTYDNLWRYTVNDLNPANDTWERIGRRTLSGESGFGSATIDTTNNLYLKTLTAESFGFWDLDSPVGPFENREIKVIPQIEGNLMVPDFRNMGVQYDPTLGAFTLWDGSSNVWLLTPPDDLDSNNDGILDVATGWILRQIMTSGAGPHIPSQYTGVYGKWVYMAEYNAYLGVIDPIAGDVFLFKMFDAATVPEAGTSAMLLVGLLGIVGAVRNRRLGARRQT